MILDPSARLDSGPHMLQDYGEGTAWCELQDAHLVDNERHITQNVVERGGGLVDDAKVNLALSHRASLSTNRSTVCTSVLPYCSGCQAAAVCKAPRQTWKYRGATTAAGRICIKNLNTQAPRQPIGHACTSGQETTLQCTAAAIARSKCSMRPKGPVQAAGGVRTGRRR